MTHLATIDQLADTLGRELEATDRQADQALLDASNFIRAYTRQVISEVTDDEVELRGTWADDLWLPQKPVTALGAVSVRYRGTTEAEVLELDAWDPVPRRGLLSRCGGWGGPRSTIDVTYDHGYAEIPEDIATACCSIAARFCDVQPGTTGPVISTSIGSFSEAYAETPAAAATVGLSALEKTILDRYRNAAMAES